MYFRANVTIANQTTENSDKWKQSETAPSCNDCVATIVTEQFTRTEKGVGTRLKKDHQKNWLCRDCEKHVELCLDACQSF